MGLKNLKHLQISNKFHDVLTYPEVFQMYSLSYQALETVFLPDRGAWDSGPHPSVPLPTLLRICLESLA